MQYFHAMPSEILTRDLSSGKVHRRYLTPSGEYATLEADNLDAAGDYEVISAEQLAEVEPGELCERCWPPIPSEEDGA